MQRRRLVPAALHFLPMTVDFLCRRWRGLAALAFALAFSAPALRAQSLASTSVGPNAIGSVLVDAREAARRRDLPRLAAARATLQAAQHPLALWAEYWDLSTRIKEVTVDEVDAFYARWPGSYVEDRLRNDWLLELGRRRDFGNFVRDYPRFRMNDDREVSCWWLLTEHQAGRNVADAARALWWAQRDLDDGCQMLAGALVEARLFSADDVFRKARLAVEASRPGAAKAALALLGPDLARAGAQAIDGPTAFLRSSAGLTRSAHELRLLAVMRLAASDLDAAVAQMADNKPALTPTQVAQAWTTLARQAAFKQLPEAANHAQRAWLGLRADQNPGLSDDSLAWGVRAVLRAPPSPSRWALVLRQIDAMSAAEQADPAWQYWKARALLATAHPGSDGDAARSQARALFEGLAGGLGFYPSLAADELGQKQTLPPPAAPSSAAEREAAARHPGLLRALLLAAIGLRDEARREWNFSLRGMAERELLAAARMACDAQDWQLCINTAERARTEVDVALRYPLPYRGEITRAAQDADLEPALVFGLIRQETRFMAQLKSSAGATGLMQVMPATGRIVARRIGLDLSAGGGLANPSTNLKLGTAYLKMVLDDLGGSQALAAAAYNAGPNRPRRWREGAEIDAAAWTETIPFQETRDYVKKVLGNAAVYATLLDPKRALRVRPRLGDRIGPRDSAAPPVNTELP